MLEKNLNQVGPNNYGLNTIKQEDDPSQGRQHSDFLTNKCSHLIGMQMKAKPKSGAFTYFSAADKERYSYMIIQIYNNELNRCGNEFRIYPTFEAQHLYNAETGKLDDPDESDNEGTGYNANWYFCKLDMGL